MYPKTPVVRLTHTPSGESVTMTEYRKGGVRTMRDNAVKILKSRLWAAKHGVARNSDVVACYDLPPGQEYPHELMPYRQPPRTGHKRHKDQ